MENDTQRTIRELAREVHTYERALNEIGKLTLTINDHDALVRAISAILRSILPPSKKEDIEL